MQAPEAPPAPLAPLSADSVKFLDSLMEEHGIKKQIVWHNNNSTQQQKAYVIDLKNLDQQPAAILRSLSEHNKSSGDRPIVAVPVAGWETKKNPWYHYLMPWKWGQLRQARLTNEYAQSFSLSSLSTAKNADIILRVPREIQKMEVIEKDGKRLFKVTPGVRVTDADKFLHEMGLALPPNMPTLHVASLVGAGGNGSYGPGKHYGPMTANIVELKIITPLGERMTLSKEENPELFSTLRDFHMGAAGMVTEITFENIEADFLMTRTNTVCPDIPAFQKELVDNKRMEAEHFVAMYIPADIEKEGEDHCPRMRITTFERSTDPDAKPEGCKKIRDLSAYLSLVATELGEPAINLITNKDKLQQHFPLILKTAALKSFGTKKQEIETDWSASIAHILTTYTDLPIYDINWLISIDDDTQAAKLISELFEITESHLKSFAEKDKYPLLNGFARYLKGIYYQDGEGGLAPTATEHAGQRCLSFEFVTYTPLAKTPEFNELVKAITDHLNDKGYKFNYHPGKHFPNNIKKVSDIFNKTIRGDRLERFQKAIATVHGGQHNLWTSSVLTPQKRKFLTQERVTKLTV